MINERYQVSAVPVERFKYSGDTVAGYPIVDRNRCYVVAGTAGASTTHMVGNCICSAVEVNPATINSVRMKPIIETEDENGMPYEFIHYRCPNCKNIIHQHYKKSKEPMRYKQNYCPDCGMALDWQNQR